MIKNKGYGLLMFDELLVNDGLPFFARTRDVAEHEHRHLAGWMRHFTRVVSVKVHPPGEDGRPTLRDLSMITATFVKDLPCCSSGAGFSSGASQKLWKLSSFIEYYDMRQTEYVITSAVNALFSGPETYIFASDEEGAVLDWCEMDGSYRGELNHEKAILEAGWEIR